MSRSFLSVWKRQYPPLASNEKITMVLPNESLHSSIRGMRYYFYLSRSWVSCSLNENYSHPSVSGGQAMGAAHYVCAGSIDFFQIILPIPTFPYSLVFKAARYGADWKGGTLQWRRSLRCFAAFMQSRWPSHSVRTSDSMSTYLSRYREYLSDRLTSSCPMYTSS